MSRTIKDHNYKWWLIHRPNHWRINSGHPPAIGGAWRGGSRYANRRNRQERRWWNMAMHEYTKVAGYYEVPERKFPHSVKWDIY